MILYLWMEQWFRVTQMSDWNKLKYFVCALLTLRNENSFQLSNNLIFVESKYILQIIEINARVCVILLRSLPVTIAAVLWIGITSVTTIPVSTSVFNTLPHVAHFCSIKLYSIYLLSSNYILQNIEISARVCNL